MTQATIITSIPPRMSRLSAAGVDYGNGYQRICLESWMKAGYRVISVNCAEEIEQLRNTLPDVEFRTATRVATANDGRVLVQLTDLLAQCNKSDGELFGIVNADIWLRSPKNLADFLALHSDDELSFGQRLDIYDLSNPIEGLRYGWGFDYFFFCPPVPFDLPDPGFVFGETWWDYWLPMAFAKCGFQLRPAKALPVSHLFHDHREWDSARQSHHIGGMTKFRAWLASQMPFPGEGLWSGQATDLFRQFDRTASEDSAFASSFLAVQALSVLTVLYLNGDPALTNSVQSILREAQKRDITDMLLWRLRALTEL